MGGEVLTRTRIVDAAWSVLDQDGLDAVSLRRVARELDVTAPALYAHIDGKNDLLTAVGDLEFEQLRTRIEPPDAATPLRAIEAMVGGYVQFSIDRPNGFQLLFQPTWDRQDEQVGGVRQEQIIELFEQSVDTVRHAVKAGTFRDVDPHLTGFTLWSVAHGIARGLRLGYDSYAPATIVSQVVDTLANGLIRT
ncbi:MAG TPA: TetR/AcrR family transcriptional regulator [Acidimicrobiales bacterium]|nr:TetR/AcrR family transcriptional regulator [Acidimicrobiales bacterium]